MDTDSRLRDPERVLASFFFRCGFRHFRQQRHVVFGRVGIATPAGFAPSATLFRDPPSLAESYGDVRDD